MIAKCTYCGGALKFDADIQMLVCEHCSGMFPVKKTEEEKGLSENPQDTVTGTDFKDDTVAEEMECSVYKCTSCGAQLILNDVEVATYCAYCGQPTIVFDRMVRHKRPKYIIPFSITKNAALVNIREKFMKGSFVPREIRYFNPDLLRGIYVPYMLYDVHCKDRQLIKSTVSSTGPRDSSTKYYYREAVGAFQEIPVDASSQIANEFSERLEPYWKNGMIEFKAEYLSGFYADLKDDDFPYLKQIARTRASQMLDEQIQKTVPGQDKAILSSHPHYAFEKVEYALFPVWFMMFHQNNETYTIMVNGQTGKVVGAVPADRRKIVLLFSFLSLIFSTLGFIFLPLFWVGSEETRSWVIMAILCIPALIIAGIHKLTGLHASKRLSSGKHIKKYVTERQDS